MQLGSVINVGLGLAFTFFLLSLIASAIQEFVAGLFKWRGTYLAKGLDVILNNSSKATFKFYGPIDWLRGHFTTCAGITYAQHMAHKDRKKAPQPLSKADIRLNDFMEAMRKHPLLRDVPSSLPSYISGKTFGTAVLSALRDPESQATLMTQVETTVQSLPTGDLKDTLTIFLQDAGRDIEQFRASIENWFDSAMDRLSGIYKRTAQFFLLIAGFLLAVILNVNALHVAAVLWSQDPAALSALAASASQANAVSPDDLKSAMSSYLAILKGQNLPIGWTQSLDMRHAFTAGGWWPHLKHFVCHHLAGWLVTTAAVSFGAPFWFGLIQNFVNLRSAGPKPDRPSPAALAGD